MSNLDHYHDLKDARDTARKRLDQLAKQLTDLSLSLTNTEAGLRLNEQHVSRGPMREYKHVIGPEALPSWDSIAAAVRAYTQADDEFREHVASLTSQDRKRLGLDKPNQKWGLD